MRLAVTIVFDGDGMLDKKPTQQTGMEKKGVKCVGNAVFTCSRFCQVSCQSGARIYL